jgi:hypothetical protein
MAIAFNKVCIAFGFPGSRPSFVRFSDGRLFLGCGATGTVSKAAVFGAYQGRKESEFVLDPELVMGMSVL